MVLVVNRNKARESSVVKGERKRLGGATVRADHYQKRDSVEVIDRTVHA